MLLKELKEKVAMLIKEREPTPSKNAIIEEALTLLVMLYNRKWSRASAKVAAIGYELRVLSAHVNSNTPLVVRRLIERRIRSLKRTLPEANRELQYISDKLEAIRTLD